MSDLAITKSMRECRERRNALLADPNTPQEVRDAAEGYKNGSIDRAELVAILERAGESDPKLAVALEDCFGWAWQNVETIWL
jgi:hypothetical protein